MQSNNGFWFNKTNWFNNGYCIWFSIKLFTVLKKFTLLITNLREQKKTVYCFNCSNEFLRLVLYIIQVFEWVKRGVDTSYTVEFQIRLCDDKVFF